MVTDKLRPRCHNIIPVPGLHFVPSPFSGGRDENAKEWLEQFLCNPDMPEELFLPLIVTRHLKGAAFNYWYQLNPKPATWADFEQAMLSKYPPPGAEQAKKAFSEAIEKGVPQLESHVEYFEDLAELADQACLRESMAVEIALGILPRKVRDGFRNKRLCTWEDFLQEIERAEGGAKGD